MVVTNSGLVGVSDALLAAFTHFALGTDATAPLATQTALITETDRFTGLTTSKQTTNTTDDTARFEGTYTFTADRTGLNEVGLFDAGVGGSMLFRQTFSDLNVQNGDEIFIRGDVVSDQA